MKLSEFTAFLQGFQERLIREETLAVMTGHWAGYYVNGGRKARPPHVHISEMRAKHRSNEVKHIILPLEEAIERHERLELVRLKAERGE